MIAKNASDKMQVQLIDVNDIGRNPRQPRADFDHGELQALASSLKASVLMQPIGVRPAPGEAEKEWELIWGERRLRATILAGQDKILARVCMVSAADALLMMGDENLNRADWNPIEKAKFFVSLSAPEEEGGRGMSDTQIAQHYKKSRPWVNNMKRLLALPDDPWQQRIARGELPWVRGLQLVPYAEQPAVLEAVANDMQANPWSWRTAEDVARNARLIAEGSGGRCSPKRNYPTLRGAAASQKAVPRDNGTAQHVAAVEASAAADTDESLTKEERMTRLAESFPSLKGAPGVAPWDAGKLVHCLEPMAHGERLAALFCLHVWNPGKSLWGKRPFNLFEAVGVWDSQHLDALRAWLRSPFVVLEGKGA
jgi:ParB/RepB/Spo0J family partition protein